MKDKLTEVYKLTTQKYNMSCNWAELSLTLSRHWSWIIRLYVWLSHRTTSAPHKLYSPHKLYCNLCTVLSLYFFFKCLIMVIYFSREYKENHTQWRNQSLTMEGAQIHSHPSSPFHSFLPLLLFLALPSLPPLPAFSSLPLSLSFCPSFLHSLYPTLPPLSVPCLRGSEV